jgi:hypothetical protein
MTSTAPIIGLPIVSDGHHVGTIRHGTVGSQPIHAAACRCGAAVYDRLAFDDAARWIRDHLRATHGIEVIKVDARRLVRRQSGPWEKRATEVVAQLAACWDDAGTTALVVRAA